MDERIKYQTTLHRISSQEEEIGICQTVGNLCIYNRPLYGLKSHLGVSFTSHPLGHLDLRSANIALARAYNAGQVGVIDSI